MVVRIRDCWILSCYWHFYVTLSSLWVLGGREIKGEKKSMGGHPSIRIYKQIMVAKEETQLGPTFLWVSIGSSGCLGREKHFLCGVTNYKKNVLINNSSCQEPIRNHERIQWVSLADCGLVHCAYLPVPRFFLPPLVVFLSLLSHLIK